MLVPLLIFALFFFASSCPRPRARRSPSQTSSQKKSLSTRRVLWRRCRRSSWRTRSRGRGSTPGEEGSRSGSDYEMPPHPGPVALLVVGVWLGASISVKKPFTMCVFGETCVCVCLWGFGPVTRAAGGGGGEWPGSIKPAHCTGSPSPQTTSSSSTSHLSCSSTSSFYPSSLTTAKLYFYLFFPCHIFWEGEGESFLSFPSVSSGVPAVLFLSCGIPGNPDSASWMRLPGQPTSFPLFMSSPRTNWPI